MEHARDDITTWLEQVIARTGETASGLARRAGLATTTLTRFLRDPEAPLLSSRTIAKIAHVTGLPPPGAATATTWAPARPAGLAESEAEPWRTSEVDAVAQAIAALIAGRNSADAWVLKTDALMLAGHMPGDVVIVDLATQPARGDVVCAQIYRWREGQAETVFRLFEPPYLVAASAAPALRMPLVVDNDRVIIKGVVTESVRARAARLDPAPK